MEKQKVVVLIFLVLIKLAKADYYCTKVSVTLCYIGNQEISATDPFVVVSNSTRPMEVLILYDGYMPQMPQILSTYPNLTMLSISNMSIQEISANNFVKGQKLNSLLIMKGQLTSLNNGTFRPCTQLTSLQVTYHQISFIDVMAFQGLRNLKNLFLTSNKMTSLHPEIFTVLPNLNVLSVENNLLTTLDSSLFSKNPNIYLIKLSQNQLNKLPSDIFNPVVNLNSLYLEDNLLTSGHSFGVNYLDITNNKLRNFTIVGGEETVHIENNFIRRIICTNANFTARRFYAFNNSLTNLLCIRDMENLTDLHIHNNKLVKPTKNTFAKLTQLKSLYLYGMTKFSTIPARVFSGLPLLTTLRVDQLPTYKNLTQTIPKLSSLGLMTTNWDCTKVNTVYNNLKASKVLMMFINLEDRKRCPIQ